MMERVTVFELGNSNVRALCAERDERGGPKVVAVAEVASKGIRKGAIVDLEQARNSIAEAWGLVQPEAEGLASVVVCIGGSSVYANSVRGFQPIVPKARTITADDVLQVVNHSRKQVIPPDVDEIQAIPQSFSIDGQNGIKKPIGLSGSKLEVSTLMVTANRSACQNIERAMETAGLEVGSYVLGSYGAGLAALSDSQRDVGSGVVDIGGGSTDIAVFQHGSIAMSASIPLGANHVTADIYKLLKTSPEEAERIKIEYGNAIAALVPPDDSVGIMQLGQIHERPMQRRVLCEIIESRMKEIATFVAQQLEKTGFANLLPGGLILTGGGSALPGIEQLFSESLNGQTVHRSNFVAAKGSCQFDRNRFAKLVGTAIHAFDQTDELRPTEQEAGLVGKVKSIWTMMSGKDL